MRIMISASGFPVMKKVIPSVTITEGQSSGEASDALISCDDAHDTRRKNKDAIKYALYQMLSSATGKTLPWGNLTGIRPVKMAMGMLESGMKNTEIAR